jgi:hypothetical protein
MKTSDSAAAFRWNRAVSRLSRDDRVKHKKTIYDKYCARIEETRVKWAEYCENVMTRLKPEAQEELNHFDFGFCYTLLDQKNFSYLQSTISQYRARLNRVSKILGDTSEFDLFDDDIVL